MSIFRKLLTDQRRETFVLQTDVNNGTTSWEDVASATIPRDGTIVQLTVWHVPGSTEALRTKPVRVHDDTQHNIPEYAEDGDAYITGEPDQTTIHCDEPVRADDEIRIRALNLNSNNDYRFRITATIDYAGGLQRVLSGGAL